MSSGWSPPVQLAKGWKDPLACFCPCQGATATALGGICYGSAPLSVRTVFLGQSSEARHGAGPSWSWAGRQPQELQAQEISASSDPFAIVGGPQGRAI